MGAFATFACAVLRYVTFLLKPRFARRLLASIPSVQSPKHLLQPQQQHGSVPNPCRRRYTTSTHRDNHNLSTFIMTNAHQPATQSSTPTPNDMQTHSQDPPPTSLSLASPTIPSNSDPSPTVSPPLSSTSSISPSSPSSRCTQKRSSDCLHLCGF